MGNVVTNNTTRVRIGYRIYSLWRLQLLRRHLSVRSGTLLQLLPSLNMSQYVAVASPECRSRSWLIDNWQKLWNVVEIKCFGRTAKNQNLIQREFKRTLNLVNHYYQSIQNRLSFRLLSINLEIRIFKTVILPVVQYVCGTLSLKFREEHGLKVFENDSRLA
jgi:hypothetical protein